MFTDALLIALLAGIAGVDLFDGLTHLHRPIVIGPIVGLILGDADRSISWRNIRTCLDGDGATCWCATPNVVIGGIIGTAFAILTQSDPKVAIGIAIPFRLRCKVALPYYLRFIHP